MKQKKNKSFSIIREEIDQYDYIDDENEDKIVKRYAESIGRFLIHFNNLDHEVNRMISIYFCDDAVHEGYMIVKDLSFRNKIELFNDLFTMRIKINNNSKYVKLEKFYKELLDINIFRNMLIHADWLTLDKNSYVRTKIIVEKEDGWLKGKKIKITQGIIRAKSRKIDSLVNQLSEFEEDVWS